jgi:hypothetical protein
MPVIWNTGVQQQTPAVQAAFRAVIGTTRRTATARRRKKKATAPKRKAKKRASSRGGKFVKGSAAAKRHMAKLRKMRK